MSAQRNALGRGLGALIGNPSEPSPPDTVVRRPAETAEDAANARAKAHDAAADGPGTELREVEKPGEIPKLRVDLIDPNPDQPRRTFDPERLQELAQSIARSGVLQPVVVTRSGDRYTLLVGERRWRASRQAGLESIPAVIADVDPEERLELAIVENVQRHDLNPIELAHAYRALAERGATQEEIGRRVGKDRSSIANLLRLLDLPVDIQSDVEAGRLSMGHAKALLQVGEPERRSALRDRVLAEGLSVRETELSARNASQPIGAEPVPRARPSAPAATSAGAGSSEDPDLLRLAEVLQGHFQSRVKIHGTPERGRIEIEYTSSEDLDRTSRLILEGF